MPLALVSHVPEGIIMATDSRRITHVVGKPEKINISDSFCRTFLIEKKEVGISTFGQEFFDNIPVSVYLKAFFKEKIKNTDTVDIIAEKLTIYFRNEFPNFDLGLHIAGYKNEGPSKIPHVYYCHMGRNETVRKNIKDDGSISFGAIYSGTIDIIQSILNPIIKKGKNGGEEVLRQPEPIDWEKMPLQDAIDFTIFAIQTTINAIRFQSRIPSVGGPIDILLIAPDKEPRWIQKKGIHGENI